MLIYRVVYGIMLSSFIYLGCYGEDPKTASLSFLYGIANAIIFWK